LLVGCSAASPPAEHPAGELDLDVQAEWENLHREFPEVIRPEVEIVRRVERPDWGATIAECLNESGFPDVSADEDGGLSYETLISQAEQFALAKYICVAQYPLEKKYTTPLDDEQLGGLYDYLTLVQAPCLETLGYEIVAPPSKQRFVETYATAPDWLPYSQIPIDVLMSDELANIQDACPESPPEESEYYLYK
jgi:hypothetical protein